MNALELLKKTSVRNWNRSICEILRKYEPRQNTTASQINFQEFEQCLQEAFIMKWTDDLWNDICVSGGNKHCAHIVPSKQSLHGNTTCQL